MQVRFENYERCYPKRLKKFFQSHLNYKTYAAFIPEMQRAVVGNLPPELIKFFPKENRANDIKDFQRALADLTRYLRAEYSKNKHKDLFVNYFNNKPTQDLLDFNAKITRMFNKILERIPDCSNLRSELQYVDKGAFASVYKLSLTNIDGEKIMHDKALKIYFNIMQSYGLVNHNNYAEANFWTFLKHAAGHKLDKTQFTRHYISDMHCGYALTEFADSKIHPTKSKLDYKNLFGISFVDMNNNMPIFGKIYDIGGFKKSFDFMDDKVVLRYFKKLFYRNSEKDLKPVLTCLEAEAQNPKNEHRTKIQKALKLFKQQQRINNSILN